MVHWLRLLTQINRTLWYAVMAMQVSKSLVREINRYQNQHKEKRTEGRQIAAHERAKASR